jgi:hypothetical protein
MFILGELLFILIFGVRFPRIRGRGGEKRAGRDWNILDEDSE